MDTSTDLDTSRRTGRRDDLPWPSLLVLGAVTFVVVVGEMLPMAVLPQMSADLGVTEARTGLLVSLWAGVVVVGALPLARLARRWDRRAVVTIAMAVFAASSAGTAVAGSYEAALVARVVGAAACGLLWASVNAHVAAIVPDARLARAVSVVLVGATLGTVLGVPAANLAADAADWRAGFWAVAVLGALVAAAVRLVVVPEPPDARPAPEPADPADARPASEPTTTAGGRPDAGDRARLRAALTVAGLAGLLMTGHFAAYTFVTPLLGPTGDEVPGGVPALLLLYGVVSAVAVGLVGRVPVERTQAVLTRAGAAVVLALAALAGLGAHPVTDVALVVAWAGATAAVPALTQTLLFRIGGAGLRSTIGAIVPVTFNLGIAAGAALGSAVVDGVGLAWLPAPAAGVAAVAAVALAALDRRRAEARTPSPGRSAGAGTARTP
ncbi:MFS transporter [Actinotalea fermentans]|nr:MFS transporter [Actinotalea fermentans]